MDLAKLNLDDPGGTVESAFTVLSVMTETVNLSLNRITERDIYTALGGTKGELVIKAIESAATQNDIAKRVLSWIQPGPDMGIDICDAEVQGFLNSMVGGSVTQEMIDSIIQLSTETRLKYPRLNQGHIIKARGV